MRRADKELIGQAILGIPGHINKAYDSYKEGQNTRFSQELQARQERRQLAEAQVRAEKARQEMKLDPQKFELDKSKHGLNVSQYEFDRQKYAEVPQRLEQQQGFKMTQDIAGGLKSPLAIAKAYGISPEAMRTPEGQAQIRALQEQDFRTQLGQGVTQASQETAARQNQMTRGAADRFQYKEGQVAQSKASPQVTSVLRGTESFLKRALDKELTDGEVVPELKRQLNVVRDIVMKKQQNGEPVTPGDTQAVQRLELEIQSRSGGAPRPAAPAAPVQQYQQPIGPMPGPAATDPIDSMPDEDLLNLRKSLSL